MVKKQLDMDNSKVVYQDCGNFSLFDNDWKASEEVALLEAVELYNYGNWGDIADFIPSKSVDQIKQHFVDTYVRGPLGRISWETVKNKGNSVQDHTISAAPTADGPLSPSLVQPLPVITELTFTQQQQLGYMPNRDDFEREYDNEVESLVATLSMNVKEEDDLDRDMKLAYIDIYNRRLAERFRRKEIVRKYELIKLFYQTLEEENENALNDFYRGSDGHAEIKSEFKDGKEAWPSAKLSSTSSSSSKKKSSSPISKTTDNEAAKLRESMKIFTQFLTTCQLDELLFDVPREREMISRIRELIRFRRSGLRKMTDIGRDKRKENKKCEGSTGNIGSGLKSTGLAAKSQEMDSVGGKNSPSKSHTNTKTLAVNQAGITSKDSKVFNSAHSGRRDAKDNLRQSTAETKATPCLDFNSVTSSPFSGSKARSSVQTASKMLTVRERKLCSVLNLAPKQYLNLKALIIKENLRKADKGKSPLENLDKNTRRKLVSFMARNGWLPANR